MKIKKAIEILERETKDITISPDPDVPAALQLGVEALKRLQDNRKDPEFDHWVLLPGETEEARQKETVKRCRFCKVIVNSLHSRCPFCGDKSLIVTEE